VKESIRGFGRLRNRDSALLVVRDAQRHRLLLAPCLAAPRSASGPRPIPSRPLSPPSRIWTPCTQSATQGPRRPCIRTRGTRRVAR